MLTDLNTYLNKAIPDTRLTIKKYLDVKFEYLVSGCRLWGTGLACGGRACLEAGLLLSAARWPAGQGWNLSRLTEAAEPGPGEALGDWHQLRPCPDCSEPWACWSLGWAEPSLRTSDPLGVFGHLKKNFFFFH